MLPDEWLVVSTLEMVFRASFVGGSWCDCRLLLLQNNLYLSSFTLWHRWSLYKAQTNRSSLFKSSCLAGTLSPRLPRVCLKAGFICTTSRAFFFPFVEKALTLSQPVAWRLGSVSHISRPSLSHTRRMLTMRDLLLVPLIRIMSAEMTAC